MEFNYKKFLPWIIISVVVLGAGIFLFWYFFIEKTLKLLSPEGKEELRAGKTYQITWESRKIGKVGVLLIKEDKEETKWIVRDFPAGKQKYDWQIFVWEEPRQDYKIAILEYPWQEGNKIDYSDENFTILGPHFASCDDLSVEKEWPFLPSDFPNLRKVFITEKSFQGNLEGLEGADKKCQEEAEMQGLGGTWRAFLGDDTALATERLILEGIFAEAKGIGILPQEKVPAYLWQSFAHFLERARLGEEKEKVIGAHKLLEKYFHRFLERYEAQQHEKACHRLLAKNFDEFFAKLSTPLVLNQEKFDEAFLRDLSNLWLGRINKESKRECTTIFTRYPFADIARNYSFTTTCKNWKTSDELIPGYPLKPGERGDFPQCYTPLGRRINAVGIAGLSSGLVGEEKNQFFTPALGKFCNSRQKLLCIEQ